MKKGAACDKNGRHAQSCNRHIGHAEVIALEWQTVTRLVVCIFMHEEH